MWNVVSNSELRVNDLEIQVSQAYTGTEGMEDKGKRQVNMKGDCRKRRVRAVCFAGSSFGSTVTQ